MRPLRVLLLLPVLAALGGCVAYTPAPYYGGGYVAPPPVYARPYGYGYGGYGYRPYGYGYGYRRW